MINNIPIKQRALEIRNELNLETHDGELAAFLAYAKTFSHNFKTLIDTYNTIESGILNTIIVSKALSEAGIKGFGVRLDSGDLCELSKKVKSIWKQYLPELNFVVFASDDLHEDRLVEMENNGSEIDVYAIGTHIATCKKQPALGLVCKLTELNKKPRMKFSSDPDKSTLPGNKVIYRVWTDKSESSSFDLITLEGEEVKVGEHTLFNLSKKEQEETHKIVKAIRLNNSLDISTFSSTLIESKGYMKKSVEELPKTIFDLKDATKHDILMSEAFLNVFRKAREIKGVKHV